MILNQNKYRPLHTKKIGLCTSSSSSAGVSQYKTAIPHDRENQLILTFSAGTKQQDWERPSP